MHSPICLDVTSAFYQCASFIRDGYQAAFQCYLKHKEQIDNYTPLILKISFYGLTISTVITTPLVTGVMAVMGYALADRVKVIKVMTQQAYSQMMNLDQTCEEDKMIIKVAAISAGILGVAFFPWWVIAIPIGVSIGSFIRLNL